MPLSWQNYHVIASNPMLAAHLFFFDGQPASAHGQPDLERCVISGFGEENLSLFRIERLRVGCIF